MSDDQLPSTLHTRLLPSDVSSLKALKASPTFAIPLLAVASGLESLSLLGGRWNEELFSKLQVSSTTSRSSVRCFAITVPDHAKWFWENLDEILALFPNTEILGLAVDAFTLGPGPPVEHFFKKIQNYVYVLRSLQTVEVRYNSLHKNLDELSIESVVAFKQRYPLLKTIITPRDQIWQFPQTQKDVTDSVPKFVGTILPYSEPGPLGWHERPPYDLPFPSKVKRTMKDG
ncbi:hypothetical protein FRC00_006404 [Tulasnella sp. 408]|nr:hypothetical protein FRC00_006404 [Tulasnella sp. 408]